MTAINHTQNKKYLAEIGGRGGRAGRGAAKARTHAQAVAAGRKGGKATAANRRARLNPSHHAEAGLAADSVDGVVGGKIQEH